MLSRPLVRLTDQNFKPGANASSYDRLYFGSGSDQNFSFPRLTDLCRMAGIDLGPTTGSCPIDLSIEGCSSDPAQAAKEAHEREAILQFVQLYEQHCAEVYEAIITPQLEKLRNIWQRFWRPSDGNGQTSSNSRDLVR